MPDIAPKLFDPALLTDADKSKTPELRHYKNILKQSSDKLQTLFENNAPAAELVHARALGIDRILQHIWQHYFADNSQIALVAVGGYGRGELHPASDIDLLLLLRGNDHAKLKEPIRDFLTFLWDIGLEIGQSVRTIKECVKEAKQDITVATNLMEARLLTGPADLLEKLQQKIGPNKIWPSDKFFQGKLEEQKQRHRRFHDSAYNLEPNIKENPGGLRDLQVVGWVAKRHFGADTLYELVTHEFLTEQEYQTLMKCQNFLWHIRNGLHLMNKRREDRLLFDYQRKLARAFNYKDDEKRLAVEKFMKDYYRTVMELSRLNEMLLQLFDEQILNAGQKARIIPLNRRFQTNNGFIETTSETVFKYYPFAILEMFLILAQNRQIRGVRAQTIRQIRNHSELIDETFRKDVRCHSLFMEIFRQPVGLTHELRRMNRYGVLARYIPAFGDIVGQMQHDLFHVYTVDEHTMFVVRNLRRLTVADYRHEFPLCSELLERIPKPELLYLAGFFHDIAKGRGGDHSRLGAEDAQLFCQRHSLSRYDTNLVAWLVANHLLMSTTAQRRDISDPEVVNVFAGEVASQERLDYLYLLTVADIRGTSPSVWNSWKDSLLKELYFATSRALRRGLNNPVGQDEYIRGIKAAAREKLAKKAIARQQTDTFWDRMDDEYFIRYSADEIAWHTYAFCRANDEDFPLILIRKKTHRGGTELFVCARDKKYIFALITATLGNLRIDVTDARIITSDHGYTLDTFIILEEDGQTITDSHRFDDIRERLKPLLSNPNYEDLLRAQPQHMSSRVLKQFDLKTQVTFGTDTRNHRTMVEVIARDRPGLLARIALALVDNNCRLQNAKIATFGERAEDIFYITDSHNQPIDNVAQLTKLKETIIEYLDESKT